MNVAAIIVTRGDQDEGLREIVAGLPDEWDVRVWDNGKKALYAGHDEGTYWNVSDLSVYGRYAAIEYTDADLIYVQDDDCVVSDPAEIVRAWEGTRAHFDDEHVVCNMPQEFRHDFYEEHALVGFGAAFHRDAPARAFTHYSESIGAGIDLDHFYRTCDIVFTALTPRVRVDVPKEDMPWAFHYTRMYRQPEHQAARVRTLDLVRWMR